LHIPDVPSPIPADAPTRCLSRSLSLLQKISFSHYIILSISLIVFGYLLMSGSGSTEQGFNPDIFSPRRIVVAPILCLAGYLLIIVGILRKE